MCNTPFHGNLTEKSIYSIILVIEGHLRGQKVNSKVKGIKTNTHSKKCNIYV